MIRAEDSHRGRTQTKPGLSTVASRVEMLRLRQISRSFDGASVVEALKSIDLTLLQGEFMTLIGPSGSGKSTLLNILGLLDSPTGGEYELSGIKTSSLNEDQRTSLRGKRIGFVFQAFHLMNYRSVVENVELAMVYTGPRRAERRPRALHALSQVGLTEKAHSFPSRLSGGERQRVAIARAIVTEPDLLLCDEPTGNLDSRTAERVLDVLEGLHHGGRTLVIITHDPKVAERGQRRLAIQDGQLVESPTIQQESAKERSASNGDRLGP